MDARKFLRLIAVNRSKILHVIEEYFKNREIKINYLKRLGAHTIARFFAVIFVESDLEAQ